LKIVIAPYLSRESSQFDEIWYADANIEQSDGNMTKIQNGQRHVHNPNKRWQHFLTKQPSSIRGTGIGSNRSALRVPAPEDIKKIQDFSRPFIQ